MSWFGAFYYFYIYFDVCEKVRVAQETSICMFSTSQ